MKPVCSNRDQGNSGITKIPLLKKGRIRTVQNILDLIENVPVIDVLELGVLHPDHLAGHFKKFCQPVFILDKDRQSNQITLTELPKCCWTLSEAASVLDSQLNQQQFLSFIIQGQSQHLFPAW